MKILHVIISKGFAGSELYVINLLNYQSNFHDTYLIKNYNKESKRYKKFLNDNIKIYDVKGFFKKIKINNIIKKINPDIVHTHLGISSRIINKKNFKLISTLHMNYDKKHYENHDALIISNKTQENNALKSFRGKIKRSLLWPCTNKIKIDSKINIRKIYSIPKNGYVFGSVGRFHKQKGFDIILDSFKKLNISNTYLILIGNGHDQYKNFKSRNIILLDHKDDIANYYNAFDCYVSASRWETFGISLIEAMSFNLPIITSIHEGNQEWINDFDILKFNLNNKKDLMSKMKVFYETRPKRKKYNLNRFDYKIISRNILNFYKEI